MSSPAGSNGKRKRVGGHSAVVVLDYGSQYTQLICRRIRELSIYSVMLPGDVSMVRVGADFSKCIFCFVPYNCQLFSGRPHQLATSSPPLCTHASDCGHWAQERILEAQPKVVILSGGPNSVHEEGSPTVPPGFFEYCKEHGVPVLGVCYGMQLICQKLGGEARAVAAVDHLKHTAICLLFRKRSHMPDGTQEEALRRS